MPFVSPVTVIGEVPPVAVCPPLDVTMYEVIIDPPLLIGASNVIVACPSPRVATMFVGASGFVAGVIAFDVPDNVLVP